MDYGRIIKRAWEITWKYKILWVFGFFLVSSGGNYSSGSGSYNTTGDLEGMSYESQEALAYGWEQVSPWVPTILAVLAVLLVLGIVWWIFSVAANGGLVHLVNEAEEGREVRAGNGWRAGFRNWGRVFVIYLLLMLPVIVGGIIAFFAVVMPIVAAGSLEDALGMIVASMCCLMIVGIVAGIVLSFLLTVLGMLAVRHSVLEDIGPIDGLKSAWSDVRTRFKDVLLMWLISIGLGIAYGIVIAVVAMFFGVGMVFLFIAGQIWLAAGLAFILFLLLLVPNAIYSTFTSAIWTIFYRQMTGRDGSVAKAPEYRVPPAPATDASAGYPPPPPTQQPPVPPAPGR